MTIPSYKSIRPKFLSGFKVFILVIFILFNFLNLDAGWGDNGDFYRIMKQYSSNPVNMNNWPAGGTPEFRDRFFSYWLPYYDLNFPEHPDMFISAQVLWLPGILINQALFSISVLWMPLLSLGARCTLFVFLWVLLNWIEHKARIPELFFLTLGVPLSFLFSTTSVVAYFNTFYQETGAIVFLPILLAVVAQSQFVRRNGWFYSVYFLVILLATTSKSSLFYLPLLTIPAVISWQQLRKKPAVFIPLALALVAIPTYAGMILPQVPLDGPQREYNSLIKGVLALSDAPEERLAQLGVPEAAECLEYDLYTTEGRACFEKYNSTGLWSYVNVVKVILAEPQIIERQLNIITSRVQEMHFDAGFHVKNDPVPRRVIRLDLWARMQAKIFPRGLALVIFMIASAAVLAWARPKNLLAKAFVAVGWLSLAAFWIDSFVQILGDGQRDLTKHLLVANLFFNFLLLAVINSAIAATFEPRLDPLKTKPPLRGFVE